MGFLLKHPSRSSLDELLEAAKAASADDTPAMAEMLRRFEGLAIKIGCSINAPHHLRDDLINATRMGLVDAVRHHNGRLGFPAFAKKYMHGAALRELGRWIVPEMAHTDDLDEMHVARGWRDEIDAVDDRLAPWGVDPIAPVIARLNDDLRHIVDLRYRRDMPVKEIATIVGTSAPAVSQRLGTIHRIAEQALAA
jgi:RNA polymerase sigma factor (sigma-70 family)